MTTVKKPPDTDTGTDSPIPPALAPRAGARAARDRRALLLLLAVASAVFLLGLGTLDLWAPDEPRYAAIAEELRSGRHGLRGLVLLHLNDQPYDQKPPLYFWLAAGFGLAVGRVDEVAARLPSALAAIASVGLTFGIARLLDRPTPAAFLSAGLLATSFRFAFTARRAQLDVLLTAFELAAIASFLVLERRLGGIERARSHPAWIAALHGALGAAALVKGPVGWLPLLVFAAWLAWSGRRAAFRRLVPAWSWLLSLGPVALWIVAAIALAPEGFAREAVGTNVFARFFAGSSHARPFYYYLYQLPLDFLPWTPFALAALPALARLARSPERPAAPLASGDHAVARFLAVWCLVPLAFFTLSAGKRGLYLLPIHPALAIACSFSPWLASTADAAPGGRPRRTRGLALAIAVVASIELGAALLVLPRLDDEKSPRPIAEAIARNGDPTSIVGLYRLRPLEGAIPYYGGRAVASLTNEEAVQAFVAKGGRWILVRAGDFDPLRDRLGLEQVARFRSGRRELILARALPRPPGRSPAPSRSAPPRMPGEPADRTTPPMDQSDAAH